MTFSTSLCLSNCFHSFIHAYVTVRFLWLRVAYGTERLNETDCRDNTYIRQSWPLLRLSANKHTCCCPSLHDARAMCLTFCYHPPPPPVFAGLEKQNIFGAQPYVRMHILQTGIFTGTHCCIIKKCSDSQSWNSLST